jgi:hypothetical protein
MRTTDPAAEARIATRQTPVVVVTLTAPGFVLRVASEPLEVTHVEGDTPLFIDARLVSVDDVTTEIDVFDLERPEISRARVSLILPEDLDGAASIEAAWHHLAASRAEVARIWPGQAWHSRRVWIGDGTVSDVEAGAFGEPLSFVVEALGPPNGDVVCDGTRLMGPQADTGYPTLGFSSLEGRVWPVVIGRCYQLPAYKFGIPSDLNGGTTHYVLALAGHHFGLTSGISLYMDGDTYTPSASTYTNGIDGSSNPIFYCVGGSTDFQSTDGAFTFDAPNGGVAGVWGQQGAAVTAAGVLAWLLVQSGARVDWPRMQRALLRLAGFEVGVYVDKETDALTLIRERLLPWLPLIEETGPDGLWFRHVDPWNDPPEIDLIAGQNLAGRTGGMKQVDDPDRRACRVTIAYGYSHVGGDYTAALSVDDTNEPLAALSRSLYGVRSATKLSCNITWDAATADRMARLYLRRRALPRFAIEYIAEPSLYGLEEGTIVRLTDESLGLSLRRGVVRRVSGRQDPPTIVVELVPQIPTMAG